MDRYYSLNNLLKRLLYLSLFISAGVSLVRADDTGYEIRRLAKLDESFFVYLDNKWTSDLVEYSAELVVGKDTESKNVIVHAYFFDKDGKQIKKYDHPPLAEHVKDQSDILLSLPKVLLAGHSTMVYYPITRDIDKRWKTLLVVFGDKQGAVYKSHPEEVILDNLDFPDKALLSKSASPDGQTN